MVDRVIEVVKFGYLFISLAAKKRTKENCPYIAAYFLSKTTKRAQNQSILLYPFFVAFVRCRDNKGGGELHLFGVLRGV